MAPPYCLLGILGPKLVASQLFWVRPKEKKMGGNLNDLLLLLEEGELGTELIYASIQWGNQ